MTSALINERKEELEERLNNKDRELSELKVPLLYLIQLCFLPVVHPSLIFLKRKACNIYIVRLCVRFSPNLKWCNALFRIRINRMFLGLPDPYPDPLVRCMDVWIRIRIRISSIIKQKK
jgi:hypothetical protein